MATSGCLVLLFLITLTCADLPLPSYMKPCARHDPQLFACQLQHGKDAIADLVKGDKKYGIPVLDPVEFEEIKVPGANFVIDTKKVTVRGLKNADLKKVVFNVKELYSSYEMVFPTLEMVGQYEVSGRILLLPISGKGNFSMKLYQPYIKCGHVLKKVKIEGKEHLEFHNISTTIDPQKAYLHFDNLFSGNKVLGHEMNELLNKEWRAAWNDFGPALSAATNSVVQNIIDNFARRVSLDAWFPEKL